MPKKKTDKKGSNKFLTPEQMWNLFEIYRDETKANPFIVRDWVGGAGHQVDRLKEKPLTMDGFENYLCNIDILKYTSDYDRNRDGKYDEFVPVMDRIKRTIRQDQIEGGMACIYNPSITQRLNNLVEKTENKHEVTEIVIKHES